MNEEPSQQHGTASLRQLLGESVRSDHPLSVVRNVAAQLARASARELDSLLQELARDDETADRALTVCAHAAELADSESVLAWARIRRGVLAERRGASQRAQALIGGGFDSLDRLDIGEDGTLLRYYGFAGQWLVDRYTAEQQFAEARSILTRMMRLYRRAGESHLELRVIVNLLAVSISLDDLQSALSHGFRLIAEGWQEQLADDSDSREAVWKLLGLLATKLFESGEGGYDRARRIAAGLNDPEHPNGPLLLILAITAFAAGDFEESLAHLDSLIEQAEKLLPEYEPWRLHHRKAYCLVQLGRGTEAQQEIRRAIRLNDSDPYLRYAAAQIHSQLGDPRGAISELTETCRLATERMASSARDEPPRDAPASEMEYLSSLPVVDLRDFALMGRAQQYRALGDTAAAEEDLRHLVEVADDVSQQAALSILAGWAEQDGDLAGAARLLERASSVGGSREADLLLELVRVLLLDHEHTRALEHLRRLSHKSMRPEEAVELLGKIPAEDQAHTEAVKWRGYARTEAGWPKEGLADLDAAVAARPEDAEALYLRALTRITLGIKPESAEWNRALTMRSVREAIQDLYDALRIDEGHGEARRVLQWLVERAAANPEMFEIFSHGGTRDGDLFRVFPELESAFAKSWQGNQLGYERAWSEAAASLHAAMEEFSRAGFEILAARTHVRLADVYLRLLDMAQVAEQLAAAESLQFLVNQPLSRDVLEQYEAFVREERGPYQKPTLGREAEYAWIYNHTYYDSILLFLVRANYRHRVGDLAAALEDVAVLQPILEHPENIGSLIAEEQALWVVAILRQAKRYDEALRILGVLEDRARASGPSFTLLYSRALIADAQGESLKAVELYKRCLDLLPSTSRPAGIAPFVQYASSLHNVGRASEAAEVLGRIDIERDSQSDRDRLAYETVAAYVFRDAGRAEEAIAAAERALAIVEERRSEISDRGGRRGWLGEQRNLFSVAIDLNAKAGDPGRAWELCELSRSRTLLDELEGRTSVSPAHGRTVAALDSIEDAIRVVENTLTGDRASEVDESLRVESVATLARLLTPEFERIRESEAFAKQDFDQIKRMLEERREVLVGRELEQREQADTTLSRVVDLTELKELLAS